MLALVAPAGAGPSVNAGTHYLQPDLAGQTALIYVTGGQAVQGLEFCAQIEDATFGPLFEDGDILTGTIFAANNLGLYEGSYVDPRRMYLGVVTQTGTVAADGLLATLTIDTTGLIAGTYSLSLTNSLEGPTNFAGISADLLDGWIVIVPEPAVFPILCVFATAWLGRRRGARR